MLHHRPVMRLSLPIWFPSGTLALVAEIPALKQKALSGSNQINFCHDMHRKLGILHSRYRFDGTQMLQQKEMKDLKQHFKVVKVDKRYFRLYLLSGFGPALDNTVSCCASRRQSSVSQTHIYHSYFCHVAHFSHFSHCIVVDVTAKLRATS